MKQIILIVQFIVLIFYTSQLLAQSNSLYVEIITRDDGIASNRVNCIYEDQSGSIWLGTQDGLNMYANDYIETYQNNLSDSSTIVNNGVNAIVEEKETGNLWIGTQNGLCYFDRIHAKFIRYFENSNGNINSLCYDKDGNLWIAADFGLYKYNKKNEFVEFKHNPNEASSINSNAVSSLSLDNLGNLWVGTDAGLDLYEPKTNTFLHHAKNKNLKRIISIYSAKNNDIWIGTYFNGLFLMKKGTFNTKVMKSYTKENGYLLNNRVMAICEDKKNNLYIADREGGLIYLDLKNDKVSDYVADMYNPHSINSNALRSMLISSTGILWIGTYNSGVNVIDNNRKPFEYYGINYREDGLFNNNIRAMFQDMDGTIWIGTKDGGGLSKFDREKGTFTHFKHDNDNPNGLKDDYVFQINEIDHQHLLIATYQAGLAIFNKRTKEFKHYLNKPNDSTSIVSNKVYTIYKDLNDTIWVGNFDISGPKGSLQIFHPKSGTFTRFDDVQNVRAICNKDKNSLWLGTYNKGLFLYNIKTNKLTPFNPKNKDVSCISSMNITSLKKDSKGDLWVGSDGGGLVEIESNSHECRLYNNSDGLPNNRVLGVEVDAHDHIWLSTGDGLARFDPKSKEFVKFDKSDGLQGNEFETYVSAKTRKGELLFGGRNGFNIFNPDNIKLNKHIPNIIFTGFELFYKPVEIGGVNSPLSKHISKTKLIELNHEQSVFTIQFIALNYTSPDKNQYAYILEGYDHEWIKIGHKHEATYANLPAGEYVFKVKASNNDGVWNKKGRSIKIRILAPWWETWTFRILLFVLTFISIFLFFNSKLKAIKKNKNLLERKVLEATNEIKIRNTKLEEAKLKLANIMLDVKHQLGKTSIELVNANNNQALAIEDISSLIDDMAKEINENALGASKILSSAKFIEKNADESVVIVSQTVSYINNISEEVGFISKFAGKTDLLAINAAIEAARAGHHGRSFGVVAENIKNLADQSQLVAKNVQKLLNSGLNLSNEANTKMTDLKAYIKNIVALISLISDSIQKQSQVANNVNHSIQEINKHVSNSVKLAENLDNAIKSLSIDE